VGQSEDARLEALVQAEGEGLFRFLYWSLGHREDALDAVQDVLIRAYRGLPSLRDEGSIKAWLYRIATNVARDVRAKRRRAPETFGLEATEDSRAALIGSDEPTPIARLLAIETDGRLGRGLAALSPELREPLLLHVVSGLKYREVAEMLGWPIGTVTTRIHAAREKLAKELDD
jgi:RNA polymerase sigma-70 factor (ECF subfamily)